MDSWGEARETETNAKWFGGIRGLIGWRNQKQKVRRTHALPASASHWPVFKTLEVEFSVNLPTCAKKMCWWLHKILISNVLAKLYPTLVRCRHRKWTYWAPSFRGISGDEVCSSSIYRGSNGKKPLSRTIQRRAMQKVLPIKLFDRSENNTSHFPPWYYILIFLDEYWPDSQW